MNMLLFAYCSRRRATDGNVITILVSTCLKSLMMDSNEYSPFSLTSVCLGANPKSESREIKKISRFYSAVRVRGGNPLYGKKYITFIEEKTENGRHLAYWCQIAPHGNSKKIKQKQKNS